MAEYMMDEFGVKFHTVNFKPQMDESQAYLLQLFHK